MREVLGASADEADEIAGPALLGGNEGNEGKA
jgi:hypothetical protein